MLLLSHYFEKISCQLVIALLQQCEFQCLSWRLRVSKLKVREVMRPFNKHDKHYVQITIKGNNRTTMETRVRLLGGVMIELACNTVTNVATHKQARKNEN